MSVKCEDDLAFVDVERDFLSSCLDGNGLVEIILSSQAMIYVSPRASAKKPDVRIRTPMASGYMSRRMLRSCAFNKRRLLIR